MPTHERLPAGSRRIICRAPTESMNTNYGLPRGAHFPGHLRDAFFQGVEALGGMKLYPITEASWRSVAAIRIDISGHEHTLLELCSLLWNCTDTMPGDLCNMIEGDLELGPCGTYASGARILKRELERIRGKALAV